MIPAPSGSSPLFAERPLLPTATWHSFYWKMFKCFGAESYGTWRYEMLASVVIGFFGFIYAHVIRGDQGAGDTFKIVLLATISSLFLMGFWHLIRAPWLLERDKAKGKTEKQHWVFGVFGLLILAGIALGGTWCFVDVYRASQALNATNRNLTATNQKLNEENGSLRSRQPEVRYVTKEAPKESTNSLRRRTVRMANELEIWEKKIYTNYPNPIGTDDNTLQKRRNEFDAEVNQEYLQQFRDRTVEVVKALESKGLDVWMMTAEWGVAKRMPRAEEIAHLRDLAHYLDPNDNVTHF